MAPKDELSCLRCPNRDEALLCKKDTKCKPAKKFTSAQYWRGFISDPNVDLSVLSSKADCDRLLAEATKVIKEAIEAVNYDIQNVDEKKHIKPDTEDFDVQVNLKSQAANATFEGQSLCKELLKKAHGDLYSKKSAGKGKAPSAGASKENNKSPAQNDEPTSSATKALRGLSVWDRAPHSSASEDAKTLEKAQGPSNAVRIADSLPEILDIPLVLCNRCHTPEDALRNPSHANDLSACMTGNPPGEANRSAMWWDYRTDSSQQNSEFVQTLATEAACQDLIAIVEKENKSFIAEVLKNYPGDFQMQLNQVALMRMRHKHNGRIITKELLEYAANMCYAHLVAPYDVEEELEGPVSSEDAGDQRPESDESTEPASQGGHHTPTDASNDASTTGGRALKVPDEINENNLYSAARPQQNAKTAVPGSSNTLFTNHFKITISGNKSLYEYQVVGLHEEGSKLSGPKKKVLMERSIDMSSKLSSNRDAFAFNKEGRIIAWRVLDPNQQEGQQIDECQVPDFSSKDLKKDQGSIPVTLRVVFKRQIVLNDFVQYSRGENPHYRERGTSQAIDLLVSHGVTHSVSHGVTHSISHGVTHSASTAAGIYQIGDNKFFLASTATDFNRWGMIALRGFSSNVKAGQGHLLLNVNTAFSVFYKQQTVAEYIDFFFNNRKIIPFESMKKHLVGLRVRIEYDRAKPEELDKSIDSERRRTKTITDISNTAANRIKFNLVEANGQVTETNVWQFFWDNHQAEVRQSDPKRFCVNTGSTDKGKECWYLADQLVVLPGQIYRRTLDNIDRNMTSEMITIASKRPSENKDAIEREGLAALGLAPNQPQPAVLRGSNIRIATSMLEVSFRRIEPPLIQYCNQPGQKHKITLDAKRSSWSTQGFRFVNTQHKLNSVIFTFDPSTRRPGAMDDCIKAFKTAIPWNGIVLNKGGVKEENPGALNGAPMAFLKGPRYKQADLIVAVLYGDSTRQAYASFRSVVDQECGKPSLVLNTDTLKGKGHNTYMASNAMKVNIRLGNENHIVAGFDRLIAQARCDTLVLGADLIHPKQSSVKPMPTIAALVGSVDERFATFLGSARRQERGKEYIEFNSMLSMANERIDAWMKKNGGRAPARILYYRDGTGNTQFKDVHEQEIQAVKTAWEAKTRDLPVPQLQMTTVMVIKRHNTRFYPADDVNQTGTRNCLPGTVVDRIITSPEKFDFFLQSHDVVAKGTSAKPTHYVVLENGMSLGERDLQDVTHSFCYNFAHSTNAVSYASPAYFADKLCERVSLYLYKYFDNHIDVRNKTPQTQDMEIQRCWEKGAQGANGNPWHKNLNDKMFWM